MARLLFGIDRPSTGEMFLQGKMIFRVKEISLWRKVLSFLFIPYWVKELWRMLKREPKVGSSFSTRKAIAYGIGFCPEDRKAEGIIPDLTVRENIILALQAHRGAFKTLTKKQQDEIVDKYIEALEIKTPTAEQLVKNLSGGNQQKVILARWLASNPRFLILDEPTRGIDVGTKAEIQRLVIQLSREGMAILFISSELEEVVRCSDRVAVLRDRQKLAELVGEQIEEDQIMHTIASKEVAA
jgi:simple sugar transport system ATP-binding protein